ncbi:MAG TPA: Sb-PDE family phosphodiesterase [Bacteroidales bacterium]
MRAKINFRFIHYSFRKALIIMLYFTCIVSISAQNRVGQNGTHRIILPNLPDYKTLKCDFHIHTVFSDGLVWPSIRVDEALRCGLDAIALTDHIEYLPFKNDINTGHNKSYEIADEYAKGKNLIVIPGTEITRGMPPGHFNALFIKDADKLVTNDVMEALKEAHAQGAFVFWDHPAWPAQCPSGEAKLFDIHKELLKRGYIQGIEIANGEANTYSDESFDIMLKYGLTPMCNSDIHGLGEWEWNKLGHRPVTLVFTKEKSSESIKEALIAGRTVVYYKNYLIGKEELLKSLFQSSLIVEAHYSFNQTIATLKMQNNSDVNYLCENRGTYSFLSNPYFFSIPAQSTLIILVKTSDRLNSFDLDLLVHNLVIAPGKGTMVKLHVQPQDQK